MDKQQAKRFGKQLKTLRQKAGLSLRQLRDLTGIDDGQISRMESGQVAHPNGNTLSRLADALDVPLADLYTLAGYDLPTELPSPGPYLRAKYRDLPAGEMRKLERQVTDLLASYGVDPTDGPAPGEDEITAPKNTNPKKKGGTS